MYRSILIPTDGSELADKAVQTAIQLAKLCGASLHAVTVTQPFPYSPLAETQPVLSQEFLDAETRLAAQRLKQVADAAKAAGLSCEGTSIEGPQVWRCIVDESARLGTELIVMASHGRSGISALLLGSETQKVLTHTSTPVLVVR